MQINRFKTTFAENIFNAKYKNGPSDTWDALAERLVEDVCGTRGGTERSLLSREDCEQLVEYIKRMQFIPGGRYLYYAGRHAKFYNNCLGANVRVITDKGYRKVSELGWANVLSPVDGKYYPAEFKHHGKQPVYKLLFSGRRGHQIHTWSVKATRTHHWPLLDGTDTYDLRIGDVVPANAYSVGKDPLGFIHGFVFGDGNEHGQLRLCANKDKKHLAFLADYGTVTYPESANGDPVLYFKHDIDWKSLPAKDSDPAYIASFISGWIQADGGETAGNKLCSVNKPALEWFREYAAYAGIVITGSLRSQIRDVQLGNYSYKDHEIFIQNYAYGEEFSGFKLVSKLYVGEEDVYCPYEPVHQRIVLEGNIDSFNCYLLRAEEDTREEWSNVTWRAMSCLMTGGGIGIDYSRLRPSGAALHRTGGIASGPIPLMSSINEIGRNVMQGGSRRSALYASLNWRHEDIGDFLKTKNWGERIRLEKESDFNFPAPLDMTNISVNYDSSWLKETQNRQATRSNLDPTFLENCYQAMRTGEPGFSFNFGKHENETLRNACTEVTSEDDSDVCNLGSINIGNIDSLSTFKDVVDLATKFLVCGTIRAELPYEKVYKVREKNRRLGLGLMGIHEWLLQRGSKYEVTPELHEWLKVYRDESERSGNEHCDRLFISRPVAFRAIAPTGSIGILAS